MRFSDRCRRSAVAALLACLVVGCERSPATVERDVEETPWRSYGADPASSKYSPLDDINARNFANLEIVWTAESPDVEWRKNSEQAAAGAANLTEFQATPLMVDGTLYLTSTIGQVFAVDAVTGQRRWVYDPQSYLSAPSPYDFIFPKHRGVAYWEAEGEARILVPTIDAYLLALDAKTGRRISSFGDGGQVDLLEGLRGPAVRRLKDYFQSSPPIVVQDTIVVGSSISDRPSRKSATPGDIRGYDVRTGERKWVFHVVPARDDPGTETWEEGAWQYSGGANAWAPMSADPGRGYVYVATSAPTNDYYGGHRKGDNLYSTSLICLVAATGERIWHQQLVHHDLWDYDIAAAPNLIDLEVDGKSIEAVAQVSKQGFVFVFDRLTGAPVWPTEEKPAPASDVPGEWTSPTQRAPVKPPPFERQGTYEADLVDFTPELRAEAFEIFRKYRTGALFTPPSIAGSLILPGPPGGTNWEGAAVDPQTAMLYVPSITHAQVVSVKKGKPEETDFDYVTDLSATQWIARAEGTGERLPLFKPPYSRITAFDLNRGEVVWQEANGSGPRKHPRLAGLDLPRLGSGAHACTMATKSLLFSVDRRSVWMLGLGEPVLRAYDKGTGELVGEVQLPAPARGCPITYRTGGRQFIVLPVAGNEHPPALVALALAASDEAVGR